MRHDSIFPKVCHLQNAMGPTVLWRTASRVPLETKQWADYSTAITMTKKSINFMKTVGGPFSIINSLKGSIYECSL